MKTKFLIYPSQIVTLSLLSLIAITNAAPAPQLGSIVANLLGGLLPLPTLPPTLPPTVPSLPGLPTLPLPTLPFGPIGSRPTSTYIYSTYVLPEPHVVYEYTF